jgi:dephospho-CoA kinase
VLRAALTGGIATGKSYVLARFAALSVPTLDADRLARQAVEPGTPAWQAIRERFGLAVLSADGRVDRRALGALVFADPAARRDLEAIVHPVVYRAIEEWFADVERAGRHRVAIADIPLLYETGRAAAFDVVIVVACTPEEQIARLMARDGLSQKEAQQRLAAQWPIGDKMARADFVIRTDGSFEDTDRQVREVYEALVGR